ncbi:hypothetical protein [Lolliginicoccus levis]|nr:hypothetical protein [Lolliginicoccus levis]
MPDVTVDSAAHTGMLAHFAPIERHPPRTVRGSRLARPAATVRGIL